MNAPANIPHKQLLDLEALSGLLDRARSVAATGELWATPIGVRILNALYDLTEVDGIYDMARDCEREFAADVEPVDPFFASDRALNRGYGRAL